MNLRIENLKASDFAAAHALNEASVPNLGSFTLEELHALAKQACYLRGAYVDGALAGFLLALGPGQDYQSLNYRWFEERYNNHIYIDRVGVAEEFRGKGIGKALYKDLEEFSTGNTGLLTCEVNLYPANPESMGFHQKIGFCEAGQQNTEGGKKRVSLLIKPLNEETRVQVCKLDSNNERDIAYLSSEDLNFAYKSKSPVSFKPLPKAEVDELVEFLTEKGFAPATDEADYIRKGKLEIVLKNKDNIYVVFYLDGPPGNHGASIDFCRYYPPDTRKVSIWGRRMKDSLCEGAFLYSFMHPERSRSDTLSPKEIVQWVRNSIDDILDVYYNDATREKLHKERRLYGAICSCMRKSY